MPPSATVQTNTEVQPLSPALGAQVTGIDLADLDEHSFELLQGLLVEHKVLFCPDQSLSVEDHVALGRRFGPLEGHPNLKNPHIDHPELFELAASSGGIADEWHTDLSFLESPSVMSILQMVTCPDLGGDTLWSNLEAAYEELSPPLRELVDGLTALHDAAAHRRPEQRTVHPVVRVHPVTGHRALYVNEHFTRRIVELSQPESDMLLSYLTRWVQHERFTVRYRWSEGTVAMWDNRCTQHFVINDFVEERVIHRVTVMGDIPTGNTGRWPRWQTGRGASSRLDRDLDRYFESMPQET